MYETVTRDRASLNPEVINFGVHTEPDTDPGTEVLS